MHEGGEHQRRRSKSYDETPSLKLSQLLSVGQEAIIWSHGHMVIVKV